MKPPLIERLPSHCSTLGLWNGLSTFATLNGLTWIIVVRMVFESLLEEHAISDGADYYETLVAYAHVYVSWMCLFTAFALLFAVYIEAALSESLRFVLLFSPLVIIVPFIDFFLTGGSVINYGDNVSDFIYNYINLFNPSVSFTMVTAGVRLEVFLATFGAFLLAWFYFKKKPLRALCFAVSLYTTIFIFGYLPALMPRLANLSTFGYFALYLPVFSVLMALMAIRLWRENPKYGKVALHLLFPSRLVFYILLLAFGFLFTARRDGLYPFILSNGGTIRFLLASISIALLFMYTKIQNDFYDHEIDHISDPARPVLLSVMSTENVRTFGGVFLLPSFAFALAAERYFFFFWLLILALSALYSELPFRLRRFYPLGHYVLSLIGASVFLAGALLVDDRRFFQTSQVPELAGCAFIGFFFLSHIKDFKDIEGDQTGGVINVFNLVKYPRVIGIIAVCGYAVVILFALPVLSINGRIAWAAIGTYLIIALTAIVTTADLRRLDWIIALSMMLLVYISILWLSTEST